MEVRKFACFSWSKLANLVEMIKLFGLDNPAKQNSSLKVLAWPDSHRKYVHFTGFHTINRIIGQ